MYGYADSGNTQEQQHTAQSVGGYTHISIWKPPWTERIVNGDDDDNGKCEQDKFIETNFVRLPKCLRESERMETNEPISIYNLSKSVCMHFT